MIFGHNIISKSWIAKKAPKAMVHQKSGIDAERDRYNQIRKERRTKPNKRPIVISLSLSAIHSFLVDLLKPYFSSRTNCFFQSKTRLGSWITVKKQVVTNAHCQIESFTDVDQVEKVHGKRRRRRTGKNTIPKTPRFWRICFFQWNNRLPFSRLTHPWSHWPLWASRNAWMKCAFHF